MLSEAAPTGDRLGKTGDFGALPGYFRNSGEPLGDGVPNQGTGPGNDREASFARIATALKLASDLVDSSTFRPGGHSFGEEREVHRCLSGWGCIRSKSNPAFRNLPDENCIGFASPCHDRVIRSNT